MPDVVADFFDYRSLPARSDASFGSFYGVHRGQAMGLRRREGHARRHCGDDGAQARAAHHPERRHHSYEGTREINALIVGRSITGLSAFT